MTDHGVGARIEILPVTGLPEFRPGDDLGAAIAAAAPWLRDGDVVVVTSKVVSKCEGRIVPAPDDPEERDRLRRNLIEQEAVRVLARRGRTLITENKQGLIQAAAGVDGSNVASTELVLLPTDPDASAAGLRAAIAERCGVAVAVIVTDTMGRAWRNGQTDTAIGSAGIAVLHGYAGVLDGHGNELVVTEVAVADEIAAAADLVKGKLTGVPVAVLRGLDVRDDGSTAAALLRSGEDDLFWLGTGESIELGRRQAQLLRRSVRRFADAPVEPDLIESRIVAEIGFPCFVKPANLGSSVGISRATSPASLSAALELAARYDRKLIVEQGVDAREIEVSVLGNDTPIASLPGEIIPRGGSFYDYKAKYIDEKGAELVIPADLTTAQTAEIQQMAVRAFQAIDGSGLARVDFFIERHSGRILLNEINTMPGFTSISMYPKLWEASGIGYRELIDRLIALAFERHAEKSRNLTSYDG